jgi:DNA adenine methylase
MSAEHETGIPPFLKWAGGKRVLLPDLKLRFPTFSGTYIEPFFGAGAVFFSFGASVPKIASDTNAELINVYEMVRDHAEALIFELTKHENSERHFYSVRAWDRDPFYASIAPVTRAARFVFLNRTCYNGLYRVNSRGEFNVPFGRYKNPKIVPAEELKKASQFLNSPSRDGSIPRLLPGDYTEASAHAKSGDLVYFDPPYDPISDSSSFVAYSRNGFDQTQHEKLRDEVLRLTSLGVAVVVSNSDTTFIRNLYSDSKTFKIEYLSSRRRVASREAKRRLTQELVITNQPSS